MSKHLKHDLEKLEKSLLLLAGQVEEAFLRAVTSLMERRIDLAERVIDGDREIDQREVEIEEDCLKLLALHQPVASDLRFVTAVLKIDNDLERIGDLATNLAERAIAFQTLATISIPPRMHEMADAVARMLRRSIDAFVRGDAEMAREICAEDDYVDELNRRIIRDILEQIHEDPGSLEPRIHLFSMSKTIERVADHATNIAEDVVYLVDGDIIRHQATLPGGIHG